MCKSTANPPRIHVDRYVALSSVSLFSFLASHFSASILLCVASTHFSPSSLSHPIIPSDILPCPGVSRRNHHASPFPAYRISSRRYSTASHPLLPTTADQPLHHHPPPTLSAPPISPTTTLHTSKNPSILASCSHPVSALPCRPCYLPLHLPTQPPQASPSLLPLSRPSFFNRS